jgi:RNA polymerase sigma-70 factor (ECF subfamily)
LRARWRDCLNNNKKRALNLSSHTTLKEIELMQKVAEFDSKALEELYNRYSSLLYTLIKKIIKDEAAAENTLVDVFAIIWKKIDKFNINTGNVYAWLVTLARIKAIDSLRRMQPSTELSDYTDEYENEVILPALSPQIEPIDLDSALRIKDDTEKALNGLTDAQQYVIYLAYYEGMTQSEIASRLNIPLSTVKSKIKIALNSLWQNLNEGNLHPSETEFSDYIIPYTLGSLDKEDLLWFNKHFIASSDPGQVREENPAWKELGEYQNLVSLLPAILNFEDPPAKIKNNIARKLYRMREELKVIRLGEAENLKNAKFASSEQGEGGGIPAEEMTALEKGNELIEQVQPQSLPGEKGITGEEQGDAQTSVHLEDNFTGFEEVKSHSKESLGNDEDEPDDESEERNYLERKVYVKEKTYVGLITIIIILMFVVIGVIAYLLYTEKTDAYEFEIDRLNRQIDNIVTENKNKVELTGIATLNNSQTLNLTATDIDSNSSGKIIYSMSDKRGYLHIFFLPPLEEYRAYQLWGNISGDFISLLVFRPSKNEEYYPFTFPAVSSDSLEFIIAESSSDGFKRPGRKVYLTSIVE